MYTTRFTGGSTNIDTHTHIHTHYLLHILVVFSEYHVECVEIFGADLRWNIVHVIYIVRTPNASVTSYYGNIVLRLTYCIVLVYHCISVLY